MEEIKQRTAWYNISVDIGLLDNIFISANREILK